MAINELEDDNFGDGFDYDYPDFEEYEGEEEL